MDERARIEAMRTILTLRVLFPSMVAVFVLKVGGGVVAVVTMVSGKPTSERIHQLRLAVDHPFTQTPAV